MILMECWVEVGKQKRKKDDFDDNEESDVGFVFAKSMKLQNFMNVLKSWFDGKTRLLICVPREERGEGILTVLVRLLDDEVAETTMNTTTGIAMEKSTPWISSTLFRLVGY